MSTYEALRGGEWNFAVLPSADTFAFLLHVRDTSFVVSNGPRGAQFSLQSPCCTSRPLWSRDALWCGTCGRELEEWQNLRPSVEDTDEDAVAKLELWWPHLDPLTALVVASELLEFGREVFDLVFEDIEAMGWDTYEDAYEVHGGYYSLLEYGFYLYFDKLGMKLDRPIPYCHTGESWT